jgi:hypothetical protein
MSRPNTSRDRFEDYVPVAERIVKFFERFPEGRVITQIIDHDRESGFVLMRAEIYRNPDDALPAATGHAYEFKDAGYVQKTSYIEVAETSAVGRGLAFLNFETKRGIASREEMEKASRMAEGRHAVGAPDEADGPATEEQKSEILRLLEDARPKDRAAQRRLLAEQTGKRSRDDLSRREATRLIEELKNVVA